MCENYIDHGWSPKELLEVYGKQRQAMDFLGWSDINIYPPAKQRTFLKQQEVNNFHALNLTYVKQLLETPELVSQRTKALLGAWHKELLGFREKNNREQYDAFLKQQNRILNLYNMSTTYQTKKMVVDALDPILQLVLIRLPEHSYLYH
jgi:hypothetical protein